jgi:hypothetical protein
MLVCSLVALAVRARADEPEPPSPQGVAARFAQAWDETAWVPKGGGRFSGYMRPLDDEGWRERMSALVAIARAGEKSVAPLAEALKSGAAPERIFAAQALGYVPGASARDALMHAAENDESAAVRLYAIDALGMIGASDLADFLKRLETKEENRDAKRHIGYALAREGKPLDPAVSKLLAGFDVKKIGVARLGEQAPDFELPSLGGKPLKLSDYRGKSAVVLVFVYGDT